MISVISLSCACLCSGKSERDVFIVVEAKTYWNKKAAGFYTNSFNFLSLLIHATVVGQYLFTGRYINEKRTGTLKP
jgi:hypothetical protein